METRHRLSSKVILVFIFAVTLDAVTVNPALCPTNKIAPHRRSVGWDWGQVSPRTFGAFSELLTPSQQQYNSGSLQEEPLKDELEDCGDIDDYDENDLSALTVQSQRRQGYDSRLLFSGLFNGGGQQRPEHQNQYPSPGNQGQYQGSGSQGQYQGSGSQGQYQGQVGSRPPARPPQRPHSRYPPTRPPYWSGGYFGSNPYRPPLHQHPSDNIKPVHEGGQEPEPTYRPSVVGGSLGHVVGVTTRPTRNPYAEVTSHANVRFPANSQATYTTSRPRPRKLNSNVSVLGSFLDLFF